VKREAVIAGLASEGLALILCSAEAGRSAVVGPMPTDPVEFRKCARDLKALSAAKNTPKKSEAVVAILASEGLAQVAVSCQHARRSFVPQCTFQFYVIMLSCHRYLMRYHAVSRDSLSYELSPLQRISCARKPS